MIGIEEHLKQVLNEGMEILTNYNVFVGNPKKDIFRMRSICLA